MKRFLQWMLALSALLAVLAAVGGYALWQELAAHPAVSVSINGEDLGLGELHAAHWGGLMLGGLLVTLVLLVVLPLTLVLGLGLPLLIVATVLGAALLALVSLGGLLLSPLLLLGLLLWLLLRRKASGQAPGKPQDGRVGAQ
jgi:hypothetical protein